MYEFKLIQRTDEYILNCVRHAESILSNAINNCDCDSLPIDEIYDEVKDLAMISAVSTYDLQEYHNAISSIIGRVIYVFSHRLQRYEYICPDSDPIAEIDDRLSR